MEHRILLESQHVIRANNEDRLQNVRLVPLLSFGSLRFQSSREFSEF